jgi:hypothetical protein
MFPLPMSNTLYTLLEMWLTKLKYNIDFAYTVVATSYIAELESFNTSANFVQFCAFHILPPPPPLRAPPRPPPPPIHFFLLGSPLISNLLDHSCQQKAGPLLGPNKTGLPKTMSYSLGKSCNHSNDIAARWFKLKTNKFSFLKGTQEWDCFWPRFWIWLSLRLIVESDSISIS